MSEQDQASQGGSSAGSIVQAIAAIAWTCVKQCQDHQPPPVLCLTHQLEAVALLQAEVSAPQLDVAHEKDVARRDGDTASGPTGSSRPQPADSDADAIAAIRAELWEALRGRDLGGDRTLLGMVRRLRDERDEARKNRRDEFDLRMASAESELLAVLKTVVFEGAGGSFRNLTGENAQRALAAIAKAEGR